MTRGSSKVLGWIAQVLNRTKSSFQPQTAFSGIPFRLSSSKQNVVNENKPVNLYTTIASLAPSIFFRPSRGCIGSNTVRYFSARSSWKDAVQDLPLRQDVDSGLKRIYFTGSGKLMLGLGTLGVFLAGTQEAKADSESETANLFPIPGFGTSPPSPESEPTIKRKLFQNLQEMFNLDPEAERKPSPEASNLQSTEHHKFERLVVGDKLVLREGDITSHQWKALSAFLASCPYIKSLRLQGMEITADDVDELCKGLKQIQNITFCDNSIGLNEGSLERLVALLLCCGMLESTSIIRNCLGDIHIPHIVSLMSRHSSLTHISLCWNGISDRGAGEIAKTIKDLNNSLRDIDLSYNMISRYGKRLLHDAGKKRMEGYPRGVFASFSIHLRHNEAYREFKWDYKEDSLSRHYVKENLSPKHKKSKK